MSTHPVAPQRSSLPSPRRASTPFTARPAIQSNCRRCHEALSGPMSYCWMCGARAAGIRWQRLIFQVTFVLVLITVALIGWRLIAS